MEYEHTMSLTDVTALVKAKNRSLPTSQIESGQDAYEKPNIKSGNDFGKEYSNRMVRKHKNAIAIFERASAENSDPVIRAWATATLPALRTNLDHSLMCQTECEKLQSSINIK